MPKRNVHLGRYNEFRKSLSDLRDIHGLYINSTTGAATIPNLRAIRAQAKLDMPAVDFMRPVFPTSKPLFFARDFHHLTPRQMKRQERELVRALAY